MVLLKSSNMDPINIPPVMLTYIPAPWIRHGTYTPEGNHLEKSVAMSLFDSGPVLHPKKGAPGPGLGR